MSLSLNFLFGASIWVATGIGIGLFIPSLRIPKRLFFILPAILTALGSILVFLTLRQNVRGALSYLLILTGITPALFLMSVLLHNVVNTLGRILLKREVKEPVFFHLAVIGCPVLFVLGVISSIILLIAR